MNTHNIYIYICSYTYEYMHIHSIYISNIGMHACMCIEICTQIFMYLYTPVHIYLYVCINICGKSGLLGAKELLRKIRSVHEAKVKNSKWGITTNCTSIVSKPSALWVTLPFYMPAPPRVLWRRERKETSSKSSTLFLVFIFLCLLPSLYRLYPSPTSHPQPLESFPRYHMISGLRSPSPCPSFSLLTPFSAHPVCSQGDLPLLPQPSKDSLARLSTCPSPRGPPLRSWPRPWFLRSASLLNSAPSPISAFVVLALRTPHIPMSQYNSVQRGAAEQSLLFHSAEQSPAH